MGNKWLLAALALGGYLLMKKKNAAANATAQALAQQSFVSQPQAATVQSPRDFGPEIVDDLQKVKLDIVDNPVYSNNPGARNRIWQNENANDTIFMGTPIADAIDRQTDVIESGYQGMT